MLSKSQPRRRKNRGRNGPRAVTLAQRVTRMSGRDDLGFAGCSFAAGSSAAEKGCIIQMTSVGLIGTVSGIAGAYFPVCPGVLGPRALILSDCFTEYKIRSIRLHYVPLASQVDATNTITVNNGSGNTSYTAEWNAVVCWVADPVFTDTFTASELQQSGGRLVNMGRPWSYEIKPNMGWLFQPFPPQNFSNASDLGTMRTMFAGCLNLQWKDAGNVPVTRTGTNTDPLLVRIGDISCEWDIDFKYTIDPDVTQPPPFVLSAFTPLKYRKEVNEVKSDSTNAVTSSISSSSPLSTFSLSQKERSLKGRPEKAPEKPSGWF